MLPRPVPPSFWFSSTMMPAKIGDEADVPPTMEEVTRTSPPLLQSPLQIPLTAVWMSVAVPVPPGADVTDFVVAPDGVRFVMIVHGASGSSVEVGAITRSGQVASVQGLPVTIGAGISQPDAVSWYGTDDVVVLAGAPASAQLYEVPLNGGTPTFIAAPGVPVSVTATSPEGSPAQIAIGLSGGKIMVSTGLGAFQPTRAVGEAPAYPG